jgi:hypothetical protein
MDHAQKIGLVIQLNFLEILEHFQIQNRELDINTVDDDFVKAQEEFFHLMSGSINRLGQWCLEIYGKADVILGSPLLI